MCRVSEGAKIKMDVIKREEAKRVAKGGRHFRRTGSGRARDGALVGERGDARRIDPAFCYRVAVPVELLCTLIPVLLLKHEACCRRERGRGDGGSGGREPCVGAPGALCRMQRENRSVAGYGIGKQVWLQALRCRRSREWKQYLVAALRETFRESVHHTYP